MPKKDPKDLWEVIPMDVDPKRVRSERLVPVVWRWDKFEISRYNEFDDLVVKMGDKCIGEHFLDLNSAKHYVYRFLESGGFPNAETNLKTLCNMTSFNCQRVYEVIKEYSVKVEKQRDEDGEEYYNYRFDWMEGIRCEDIYEVAKNLQTDFLLVSGFNEWKNGKMRLEFIKKNTPQENISTGEQQRLLNHFNLRDHKGKW